MVTQRNSPGGNLLGWPVFVSVRGAWRVLGFPASCVLESEEEVLVLLCRGMGQFPALFPGSSLCSELD